MRRTVFVMLAVLLSTAFGQWLPTGEFLIDTSGTHREVLPAAAFDGTNFLVVWEDQRNGGDICGARVSPGGVVLDPAGVVISTAANRQEDPAVAFDGTNFLVVWRDGRISPDTADIYGTRVTPSGVVLDSSGIAISTASYDQGSPAVAFDGTSFLVVWHEYRSRSTVHIYGARVTPAGAVLDTAGIPISGVFPGAYWENNPSVAYGEPNFIVFWNYTPEVHPLQWGAIHGTRVSPAGMVLDTADIVVIEGSSGCSSPEVAFDGENFLAVWGVSSVWGTGVAGARVSPAGIVLGHVAISSTRPPPRDWAPVVAFDGFDYLVVWQRFYASPGDTGDIRGAWVSPTGVVTDSGPVVTQEGTQSSPTLARGAGSQLFFGYQGWAGTVGGKTYNTDRVWGKMIPSTGVQETPNAEVRTTTGPSIVRRVLELPRKSGTAPGFEAKAGTVPIFALLDISGRKVLDLHAGANDVRTLAPGIYFVRSEPAAVNREPSAASCRKVVVTR